VKILVAHDDADLLAKTTEALRRAGHRVVAPTERAAAIDGTTGERLDLILRNVGVRATP
jgi:DNA-binding response OmpR family regulator